MYGAIEAGGTKFVCAVGDDNYKTIEQTSFPTTTPAETMKKVFEFFDAYSLKAIGIGSFGPIDIDSSSGTYGYITNTPKTAWKNFNLLGAVKDRYAVPTGWTTDVNIAALSETAVGAAEGLNTVLYLTVGTGIGGGAIVNGQLLEGFGHPEMGHIRVRKHPSDSFEGLCPYHHDCLEGLAAGPTIEARLNQKGFEIDQNHEIWDILADYMAQALCSYTMILRPQMIILGGGVMKSPVLLPLVKEKLQVLIANYVSLPQIDDYVVLPKLQDLAGITGGFILAEKILNA